MPSYSPLPFPAACAPAVAILLAAGQGARYAAQVPGADKLMTRLPDGRPVAAASAATLRTAVGEVLAVLRPGRDTLAGVLREQGCEILVAEAATQGMGASLAAAARHLLSRHGHAAAPAVLVALADMPWIRPVTCQALLRACAAGQIAAASHQGRRGHPVAFPAACLPELATLGGDTGARALLQRHGCLELELDDPGVLRDIDIPCDIPAARAPLAT